MPINSHFSTIDGGRLLSVTEIVAKEAKDWTGSRLFQRESADGAVDETCRMLWKVLSSYYILFWTPPMCWNSRRKKQKEMKGESPTPNDNFFGPMTCAVWPHIYVLISSLWQLCKERQQMQWTCFGKWNKSQELKGHHGASPKTNTWYVISSRLRRPSLSAALYLEALWCDDCNKL